MEGMMSEIGEKAFLRNMLPILKVHESFINGFGHDASVVDVGLGDWLIIMKIDRAATPIASKRGWSDYKLWGRLAVTSNCSDILASGGIPKAMMAALCIPRDWQALDVMDVIFGCEQECIENNIAFIGGDTKEAPSPEVVGAAMGLTTRRTYLPRNGARPGHSIMLAGLLGGYVGSYLQLVESHTDDISSTVRDNWLDYISHPKARWIEASVVRDAAVARAGMDTSDGLYEALIAMTSGNMGVDIDLESLPYHVHALQCHERLGIPLLNTAFGVGDWNIVFAVESNSVDALVSSCKDSGGILTCIGKFIEKPMVIAHDSEGNYFRMGGVINEHFRSRMEDQNDFMDKIRNQLSLHKI